MSASDHLSPVQFRSGTYDFDDSIPSIEAHIGGERAGYLAYQPHEGSLVVNDLSVAPQHQRRGIASALMDEMVRRHPDHTVDHGQQTNAGAAWYAGYRAKGGSA